MENFSLNEKRNPAPSSPFPDVSAWQEEFKKSFVSSYTLQKRTTSSLTCWDSLKREVFTVNVDSDMHHNGTDFFVFQLGPKYENGFFNTLNKFEGMFVSMPLKKAYYFMSHLSNKLKACPDTSKDRESLLKSEWEIDRKRLWDEKIKVS